MKSINIRNAPKLSPVKGLVMDILGSGEKLTLIHMIFQPGVVVPMHSHPNEQIGTCIKGEGTLVSGGKTVRAYPGASWTIPAGEPHEFTAGAKPVTIIEAWSPPREDYVAMSRK